MKARQKLLATAFVAGALCGPVAAQYDRQYESHARCVVSRSQSFFDRALTTYLFTPGRFDRSEFYLKYDECESVVPLGDHFLTAGMVARELLPQSFQMEIVSKSLQANFPALLERDRDFLICAFDRAALEIGGLLRSTKAKDSKALALLVADKVAPCEEGKNGSRLMGSRRATTVGSFALAAYAAFKNAQGLN